MSELIFLLDANSCTHTATCCRANRAHSSAPALQRSRRWMFEPKYDGFRGMFYLSRQSCALYSKRGNRMTRFQDLAEQVRAELGRCEVILDGEIAAIDDEGPINFWDVATGLRP